LFPEPHPRNFEQWVSNEFGRRLFKIFFKSYTEKVWGMSCREISADWAAQRIKGLSLGSAIRSAFLPRRSAMKRSAVIKTLISSFRYPRKGPGMMWETAARKFQSLGGTLLMGSEVVGCEYDDLSATWKVHCRDREGRHQLIEAEHVISSAPMRELIRGLAPAVPRRVLEAAERL